MPFPAGVAYLGGSGEVLAGASQVLLCMLVFVHWTLHLSGPI